MNMKEVDKIICIGSNCIAADITHSLGVREKGPVDNIADFNIWNAKSLFNGKIKEFFFNKDFTSRLSTKYEIEQYNYAKKVFTFVGNFSIVHNDFEDSAFKKSLKKRIKAFQKFYKKSMKNEKLWYIYSVNYNDDKLTEEHFRILLTELPSCCSERLICVGIRGKNSLFEKYFKYYVELDSEDDFCWNDKNQALMIMDKLLKKYDLRIKFK